jgi:hypothetical protein
MPYRIYRSQSGPPRATDAPWATAASLPVTPADTFADGTYYLAVSFFDGTYDSGFLPIGPVGEPYLVLTVAGGAAAADPPPTPLRLSLVESAPGVAQITAIGASTARADQWRVLWSIDGGTETEVLRPYSSGPLSVVSYALPAQTGGEVVRVTVSTRRNDGTSDAPVWVESLPLTQTLTLAPSAGPAAPPSATIGAI